MRPGPLAMIALLLALIASAGAADGAVVLITDPVKLHATDQVNWSTLGPTGTIIPAPFQFTTAHGMRLTVATGGSGPSFKRLDQGNGFSGDFAPGTPLLATNSLGSLDIKFPTRVHGAGAFVEHATLGSFTQYVLALSGTTVVAEFTVDETNDHLGNGTAGFIGVLSDQDNITEVFFDSFRGGNTVSAGPLIAVPLPAGLAMAVSSLPLVWLTARALRRNCRWSRRPNPPG
jgi:hypothetical protein